MTPTAKKQALRVLHVVPGLGRGGAEMLLVDLVGRTGGDARHHVVVLGEGGPLVAQIRDQGAEVTELGLGPLRLASAVRRVRALAKAWRPTVVQGWLYVGNAVASLAARGRWPVAWALHHQSPDRGLGAPSRLASRLCAGRLRNVPARIVFVAESALEPHGRAGYPLDRAVVIPNGVDTSELAPVKAREALAARTRLDLPTDAVVVGRGGRLDPAKDYPTYFEAARLAGLAEPETVFLAWGKGLEGKGPEHVRRFGVQPGSKDVLAALDVLVSSSADEAAPLILLEAMARGLPCVTTDVGDCAVIVGDTGWVVPARDPPALADAILEAVRLTPAARRKRGQAARARAIRQFELAQTARSYLALWGEVGGAA